MNHSSVNSERVPSAVRAISHANARYTARALTLSCALFLPACSSDVESSDGDASQVESPVHGGDAGDGGLPPEPYDAGAGEVDASGDGAFLDDCTALRATVRDFKSTHPDFENMMIFDAALARNGEPLPGIVSTELGPLRKPVYVASGPTAVETTGADNFNQWYNDVPGVNVSKEIEIPLTAQGGGRSVFDSTAFFPLDDEGFGNEGNAHNAHFTTEIHTAFVYRGGEVFTFRGDDDLWMFVNGKLAIDLGGIHPAHSATVDFDAQAAALGIQIGERYTMDIFHAERYTPESNFRIETSIDCFVEIY